MATWLSIIMLISLFFFVEISIYISFLLIKALKIYIRKNNSIETINGTEKKSKAGVIGIAVFNIILVVLIIAMPHILRNNDIYNTENVIICNQNEVDKFTELLDDNKIEYKIIGNTKVKMQNKEDLDYAIKLAQENRFSYSVINVVH